MTDAVLEAVIDEDGGLRVAAPELASLGVVPGDRVKVMRASTRRVRSMLGVYARPVGFTDEDQRDVRSEMGHDIGGDLLK